MNQSLCYVFKNRNINKSIIFTPEDLSVYVPDIMKSLSVSLFSSIFRFMTELFKNKVFPIILLPVNIITIEFGEGPGKVN